MIRLQLETDKTFLAWWRKQAELPDTPEAKTIAAIAFAAGFEAGISEGREEWEEDGDELEDELRELQNELEELQSKASRFGQSLRLARRNER